MQSLSDIELMLAILVFLMLFYVAVASFYVKIRVPKVATRIPRGIPTECMDSPWIRCCSWPFIPSHVRGCWRHDGSCRATIPTIKNRTKVWAISTPIVATATTADEGEGTASPEEVTDESEKTMERVENSKRDDRVTEETVEKLEVESPDQIETSERPDVEGLDYHADFEGFVETLRGLEDAVDELKRRIRNDAAVY